MLARRKCPKRLDRDDGVDRARSPAFDVMTRTPPAATGSAAIGRLREPPCVGQLPAEATGRSRS